MQTRANYLLAGAMLFACLFATVSNGPAQTVVFGFDDHNGSPDSGSYMPGDSFTFTISLTFAPGGTVANLDGLSYWFEQQNPNAPFYFSITNRNLAASQFNNPQTLNLTYPQNMTPQNTNDLGGFRNGAGLGGGIYFIADLTIHIDASAAPGIYQIENTTSGGKTSIITDDQGHTAAIPQAIYTITVVPEPSTLALCAGGLMMAAGFLRKRHD